MTTLTLTVGQIVWQLYMGRVFISLDGKKYNSYKKMLQFERKYKNRQQLITISLSDDKEIMTQVTEA